MAPTICLTECVCVFLCVFEALLDQLKEGGTSGDVTNENVGKMLEDAQRMVKDMENRNFTPQKTAAEKERDEAKKRMIISLYLQIVESKPLQNCFIKAVAWWLYNHYRLVNHISIHLFYSIF